MQPLGRKPCRWPSKVDYHPQKGHLNWWEVELETASKGAARNADKQLIREELEHFYKQQGEPNGHFAQ